MHQLLSQVIKAVRTEIVIKFHDRVNLKLKFFLLRMNVRKNGDIGFENNNVQMRGLASGKMFLSIHNNNLIVPSFAKSLKDLSETFLNSGGLVIPSPEFGTGLPWNISPKTRMRTYKSSSTAEIVFLLQSCISNAFNKLIINLLIVYIFFY